jgi:hypothetical protein
VPIGSEEEIDEVARCGIRSSLVHKHEEIAAGTELPEGRNVMPELSPGVRRRVAVRVQRLRKYVVGAVL